MGTLMAKVVSNSVVNTLCTVFEVTMDEYLPLRDVVFNTLRRAILRGELKPGERLMEIQLANKLGVSRTPIREAIRKLELEGFVVMIPRRGTYVADISIKDINEVYEIRTSLEVLAAGLAAERISDEELETMQRLLVEIGQHIEDGNIEKIVEIDTAFHDVLYKASRNKRLAGIINNLREQITVIRRRSMMYPGRLQNTMEEHRILVDSIAAHDVDRAQNAARLHMENAEHTLLKDMLESAERKKK